MAAIMFPVTEENAVAIDNFNRTAGSPVRLSSIAVKQQRSRDQLQVLKAMFPEGEARFWGLMGKKHDPRLPIKEVEVGDCCYFVQRRGIVLGAVIAAVFHSREFADRLWPVYGPAGRPWEHVVALTSIRAFEDSCSAAEICERIIGHPKRRHFQGCERVEDKLDRFRDEFPVAPADAGWRSVVRKL
ncbi:hypothetical protein [Glycomyces salinus]|uniref:hypothetical protein n=1 Tax=Glycomyces salinus TaxID=980294 RepID=UPI0018EBE87D|nr:hypothetical protein [Glycomyces salinus]